MKRIAAVALFLLNIIITILVAILFGLTFIGVQIGSWTGRRS